MILACPFSWQGQHLLYECFLAPVICFSVLVVLVVVAAVVAAVVVVVVVGCRLSLSLSLSLFFGVCCLFLLVCCEL